MLAHKSHAKQRRERRSYSRAIEVEQNITCVDCGGRCHLLSYPPPDEGFAPGDVVAYRCEDCMDRWDLVIPDDDYDGRPD